MYTTRPMDMKHCINDHNYDVTKKFSENSNTMKHGHLGQSENAGNEQ